ncbi:transcription elongation factor GreB [Ahniella affigens]|uniref:Transcription elongation factor GreB n=1 Tax=Ahniella affigens TaxID=2021234 RepID=A0A2P1PPW3_9GAMM|nr:transcription elongation factor GreB [Ahniella affigens]
MGRWRPPQARSTAIITADGHLRLKQELDHLWRTVRPEVVRALAAAAAEGDRSENAEYTYRKKQLGEIDRRVRYLSKRIPALRIAPPAPTDQTVVFFGATVELEDEAGKRLIYRVVGPDETHASKGWISVDSPMARAMLKKRVDDEFQAQLPGGEMSFVILAVRYEARESQLVDAGLMPDLLEIDLPDADDDLDDADSSDTDPGDTDDGGESGP